MSVVFKGSNQVNTSGSGTASLSYTITTPGSMIIVFAMMNYAALTSISDSNGNVWRKVTDGVAGGGSIYYCSSNNGSGSTTINLTGASGVYQICIAEYTGASYLSNSIVLQGAGFGSASPTPVNCGPIYSTIGVFMYIEAYQQASGYTSTSGSTNRTVISGEQGWFTDNLSATGSYTETGTIAGNTQFGGGVTLLAFANPGPVQPIAFRPSYGSGRSANFGVNG